jgi:hypothetical protein
LLVHLLDQGGIARETAGIQIAHLLDQGLQLLPRLGTVLHYGTNLVEKVQSLVNLALRIGRIGTLLGRHRLTVDASIAGVISAKPVPIAIGPASGRIADRTGEAVADRTQLALAPAALTRLLLAAALATGLTALTGLSALLARLARLPRLAVLRLLPAGLTGLTGLPVAVEWPGFELLAGTAGLTLSRLRVGTSAEAGELVAQMG